MDLAPISRKTIIIKVFKDRFGKLPSRIDIPTVKSLRSIVNDEFQRAKVLPRGARNLVRDELNHYLRFKGYMQDRVGETREKGYSQPKYAFVLQKT